VLALAAALLVGCSSSDTDSDASGSDSGTPGSDSSAPATPGEDGEDGEDGAGSGESRADEIVARVNDAGVPEGWKAVDAAALVEDGTAAEDPVVQTLAERLDASPEQLVAQLQGVELLAIEGEEPDRGPAANLNVLRTAGALGSAEQSEEQLKQAADSVEGVDEIETAFGDGQRATFTVKGGGQTLSYVALILDAGGGEIVNATVTAGAPDAAAAVADDIEAALQSA